MTTRHLAPLLAVAAALALACGGSSSSASKCPSACPLACDSSGKCPAVQCPSSCPNSCDSTGKCVALTCTQDMKPVTSSEAASIGWAPQHLGSHTVGEAVQFTVPAGTTSVTIVEQAVKAPDSITQSGIVADNTAVPFQIKDPNGTVVYDDTNVPTDPTAVENALVYFGSSSPATGTVTFPNSTGGLSAYGAGVAPGNWTLTVGDWAYECSQPPYQGSCTSGTATDSVYDVTVIPKKPSGSSGTTLDVTFWIATAEHNLSKSAGLGDAGVSRLWSTLKTLLARGGVTLGTTPGFQELTTAQKTTYDTSGINVDATGACADLAQMLKLSGQVPGTGNTVNVFLVSNLVAKAQGNAQVVGIDGTIPGPATFTGTVASGVAASVGDLRFQASASACTGAIDFSNCGADEVAYVIAHEIGHTLGLYHVTEGGGSAFDPLNDTLQCPCKPCAPTANQSQCTSSSFQGMQLDWCSGTTPGSCGGGDNLMFWLFDPSVSTGTLSADQGHVMQLNPLVH